MFKAGIIQISDTIFVDLNEAFEKLSKKNLEQKSSFHKEKYEL